MPFKLQSTYQPDGDQPTAIADLVAGLKKGYKKQTLLGVTGSGKTFTVANVIQEVQMPTLVIAHNKTLAAQLCNEFREFFPDNAVEYFVSYYDYYQPEAYMPHTDTYIEKEAQINEEIDRLRHACTQAVLTRRDVIIVASVSAIYGLGSPAEYEKIVLHLGRGDVFDRRTLSAQLIDMQFVRTNADLTRGTFRMRGQVLEVMPVNEEMIYRLEMGSHINRIERVDPVARTAVREQEDLWLFPAKHYVASPLMRERAFSSIGVELEEQLAVFQKKGKLLEYERLKRRVKYDLEMIKNIGYCNGIENYSRHFDGRGVGEPPYTLLDYFGHSSEQKNIETQKHKNTDFLVVIDESHVTLPQIRGMYAGDKARKDTLVEHGFRLPSARDNRPLTFAEFEKLASQTLYVSATPSEFEMKESAQIAEQIVRPTGLIDPEVMIRPVIGKPSLGQLSQIEDLLIRIEQRVSVGERVLVTTLTKKMAEDLTSFLLEKKMKVAYIHSDIDTSERIEIITDLRRGKNDVIVGVNLLREGLDMPEVSLVAILDADKEGFLRSDTSLIQTIGRAARNVNGQVVLYADHSTGSIERALSETNRRRLIQLRYNVEHGITPKTIQKKIKNILEEFGITARTPRRVVGAPIQTSGQESQKAKKQKNMNKALLDLDLIGDTRPVEQIITDKEQKMREAAHALEFELAALLRDEIRELKVREHVSPVKKKKKRI